MGAGVTSARVFQQSPNRIISETRLEKARELLIDRPELNITEISERVGFNSPKYFTRCFRDRYGISPKKYCHKSLKG